MDVYKICPHIPSLCNEHHFVRSLCWKYHKGHPGYNIYDSLYAVIESIIIVLEQDWYNVEVNWTIIITTVAQPWANYHANILIYHSRLEPTQVQDIIQRDNGRDKLRSR